MLMGLNIPLTNATDVPATPAKRLHLSSPVHNYGFKEDYVAPARFSAGKPVDGRAETAHRDIGSRFGQRLRELRQERNLTQSQMAKKFGIDRSFISDVERGRKSISLGLLEVVALGLKVSLSALFKDL